MQFYHVDPEEWEASEAKWRKWVERRRTNNVPLDPGRFHKPVIEVRWEPIATEETNSEARFSKVLEAQHNKCVACDAIRIVEHDRNLTAAEKAKRLERFAHTVPRLQPFPSTGHPYRFRAMGKLSGEEWIKLVGESSWPGLNEQEPDISQKPEPSILKELEKVLPKPDIFELKPGSLNEFGARREHYDVTKHLLQDTNNGSVFEPYFLIRAEVLRRNEHMIESSMGANEVWSHLSDIDKKIFARAAAEAWELERDLLRLESMEKTLQIRMEWAQKGYSTRRYVKENARVGKENHIRFESPFIRYRKPETPGRFANAYDDDNEDGERVEEEKDEIGKGAVAESAVDRIARPLGIPKQDGRTTPVHGEAVELTAEMNRSSSRLNLAESSEHALQEVSALPASGPSKFFSTMQNFHQHNLESVQDDSKSTSTNGDPFRYDIVPQALPSVRETPTLGNRGSISSVWKGKAKKDSKVATLLEADGVSVKDFQKPEKKPRGLRKLSIRAGSSRLGWR